MISPRLRPSIVIPLVAALALFARDAAAQLEFAGIPWGTGIAETTERIRGAGYTLRGTDQEGDVVFGAADGVDLFAMFDSAGLVYVEASWERDPDHIPARYTRMADSLRAALGTPDDELGGDGERTVLWRRDAVEAELYLRPRSGGLDTLLILRHSGPGWVAELERRDELARARKDDERQNGRADTTAVGDWHQAFGGFRVLIRVDTIKYARVDARTYRARFLHNWMQTRRLANGMMYTAAVTEVELDCRGFRTRLHRTVYLFDDRALPAIDVAESERVWTQPLSGAPDDVAIRSACEALARQP
jgi:hypothetical protein